MLIKKLSNVFFKSNLFSEPVMYKSKFLIQILSFDTALDFHMGNFYLYLLLYLCFWVSNLSKGGIGAT